LPVAAGAGELNIRENFAFRAAGRVACLHAALPRVGMFCVQDFGLLDAALQLS
jgi:hypothetical protein